MLMLKETPKSYQHYVNKQVETNYLLWILLGRKVKEHTTETLIVALEIKSPPISSTLYHIHIHILVSCLYNTNTGLWRAANTLKIRSISIPFFKKQIKSPANSMTMQCRICKMAFS